MGCCISKCRPKKSSKYKEECSFVQDKLVISQAASSIPPPPPPAIPLSINKKAIPPPLSPTSSAATSFSCTCSHGSTISCSSSSSTASSTLISSKEKSSFSNEFLWSCVKENPHIVRADHVKESPAKPVHTKVHHTQKLDSSPPARQSIPQRAVRPTPPQKRARPNSPTLTRQKSFRREPAERSNLTRSLPNRTLMRSPSPSRRFNGENLKNVDVPNYTARETCGKRAVGARKSAVQPMVSSMRMENIRPGSPSSNSTTSNRHWRSLKDRETWNYRIGSKIDETAVGEVISDMEIDSLLIEDINNPQISLDCFIFL